jgi:hypothetical protein
MSEGTKYPTVEERIAATGERRRRHAERDSARVRLAGELGATAPRMIAPERGFEVVPPGGIRGADAVVAAANEVIDEVDLDAARERAKAGSIVQNLVVEEELTLDSPLLEFALSPEIVGPVAAYLDIVPVLGGIDVWCSLPTRKAKSSQLWHLDAADSIQIKVWVHCSDIGAESGPLTALSATASSELAERIGYRFDQGHRVPDQVFETVSADDMIAFEGPAGTVDFVDTSRCFHFGSRVREGAPPRRAAVFQYVTPYAFRFEDHREDALFRHLGVGEQDELRRLVLGTD